MRAHLAARVNMRRLPPPSHNATTPEFSVSVNVKSNKIRVWTDFRYTFKLFAFLPKFMNVFQKYFVLIRFWPNLWGESCPESWLSSLSMSRMLDSEWPEGHRGWGSSRFDWRSRIIFFRMVLFMDRCRSMCLMSCSVSVLLLRLSFRALSRILFPFRLFLSLSPSLSFSTVSPPCITYIMYYLLS